VSVYGKIFAALYDPLLAWTERSGLREHRRALLAKARGRVLEIGAGTGLNLAHYTDAITDLTLAEPEEPMARRLERRLAASGRKGAVVHAPAEQLPFEDHRFDTVVSTLVLCTVVDPDRSLAEIKRVLAPGGQLLFLEHVRSENPLLASWQDRLHGPWLAFGHGCHCNRPTQSNIERAGFTVEEIEHGRVKRLPVIVRPLIVGRAAVS
jgi:ubiquinone/menaquinone biosynthesis C-methylase UbiE